jgi:hypothetical protein
MRKKCAEVVTAQHFFNPNNTPCGRSPFGLPPYRDLKRNLVGGEFKKVSQKNVPQREIEPDILSENILVFGSSI